MSLVRFLMPVVLSVSFFGFHFVSSAVESPSGSLNPYRSQQDLMRIRQLKEKNLSQAFWREMRHSVSVSQIRDWEELNQKDHHFYRFLFFLLNDLRLTADHFYNSILKKQGSLVSSPEDEVKAQGLVMELLRVLKEGRQEEIQKFIEAEQLTKADKILVVLYLIYHGSLKEKIFELMSAVDLSVNDRLSFKDINSVLVPEEFKNKDETAVVLSHHLLALKEPQVMKTLMEEEIDFSLRLATGDNIIHSYLVITASLKKKKSRKKLIEGLITLLQHPQAERLLTSKNALDVAPINFAFLHSDKKVRDILYKKAQSLRSLPRVIRPQGYTDIWNYLMATQKETKTNPSFRMTYLDFRAFFQNWVNFFEPYQSEKSRPLFLNFFNQLYMTLKEMEKERLLNLYRVLSGKEKNQTQLILSAVFNRDEIFFKTLAPETVKLNEFVINSSGEGYLLSDLLLEAIRHSFAPAVEYILTHLEQQTQRQRRAYKKVHSYSLDPLSLAFVTYGSLEAENPLKQSAKEIINLLYKKKGGGAEIENYNFPLNFSPIEWALFFGLKDEVQFLHETKKIDIPQSSVLQVDGQRWLFEWRLYVAEQNFSHLARYISQKSQDSEIKEESTENFLGVLGRISEEAFEKTKTALSEMSPDEWLKQALGEALFEKYQKGQLKLRDFEGENPGFEEGKKDSCKKHFINRS